ncbi:MAG: 30S ribosomal protein S13 [bacterium]
MVRIAGIALPGKKRAEIGLTYIYGIGQSLSRQILDMAKIDYDKKIDQLSDNEANLLREIIERQYKVEGNLKREVLTNIKRLKEIGSYRGVRHTKNLPVRGQRTKTNTRTVRGNVRKTMASGRKSAAQKT